MGRLLVHTVVHLLHNRQYSIHTNGLQFALEGIPTGINIDVSSQEVGSHFFHIAGQRYQNFTDLLAFGSVINQLRRVLFF